ncbi:substrate-binding domain-containing protein [Kitasatospora sp. NPDC089913]|uniref:substrate-binding domain-containing protein n=1 Tax=Kitasatospora sp. NPDC089913 TaxID=3364080 RepID=UPI0037F69F85
MLRLAARAAPALALTSALALAVTTPALADPPQPAATDIVGVGSGISEALLNQISTDYNAALAAAGDTTSPRLYSWDSTGNRQITPKAGADTIVRPDRSNAGVLSLNSTTSRTVDFARSARLPQPSDLTSDVFVGMAKDAISWAAPSDGYAPANLTTAQLSDIYNCHKTNWRQIDPALPDAPIVPVLAGNLVVSQYGVDGAPTDSSGFFLKAINYPPPSRSPHWDRSCVRIVERGEQGGDAVLHDPGALVPFSVGGCGWTTHS